MNKKEVIRPFRGVLYNPAVVGDLSNVIAPPYDVIDTSFYDQLFDKHPRNCVRLILASRSYSYDIPEENYRSIRETIEFWMRDNVLLRDGSPAIYALQQMFDLDGEKIKRRGIICELNLSVNEDGMIIPHEKTMKGPIEDRFKMLQYVRANFSPIFLLYSDPKNRVNRLLEQHLKGPAEIFCKMENNIINRLWRVTDKTLINKIVDLINQNHAFYIADGHHRFATALQFRDFVKREGLDFGDFHLYTMVYITCMEDEGLVILPIHRVVHGVGQKEFEQALGCARDFFKVKKIERAIPSRDRSEFISHLFREFKEENPLFFSFTQDGIWGFFKNNNQLDEPAVCLLHNILIKKCLKKGDEQSKKLRISYEKNIDLVFRNVFESQDTIAFLLKAITPDEFKNTISAGKKLVEKSTFFYPKLPSGLVMRIG